MIQFSVLSATGQVLRKGTCPEDLLELQAEDGETVVRGWVDTVSEPPILNYTAKREREYPSIGDQLDMLWHAMDTEQTPKIEPFYSAIKAVKARHPKPPQ